MPIDWSNNASNTRLLAAAYAEFGRESYSGRYTRIAQFYGGEATYDAIQKRFTAIAKMAEQLRPEPEQLPQRPAHTRRSASRKPPRNLRSLTVMSDMIESGSADPEDVALIEENQARILPGRLRNRPPRPTCFVNPSSSTASTPGATSSSDFQDGDIEHDAGMEHDGDISYREERKQQDQCLCGNAPNSAVLLPSSVEPVSHSFEADLAAKADETMKVRTALTSQEHEEERVGGARKDRGGLPVSSLNDTSTPGQQPLPTTSSESGTAPQTTPGRSFIDKIIKLDKVSFVCRLCKREWSCIADAQQHEALSALHSSNLQEPSLVTAALTKLSSSRVLPSASRTREYIPGDTLEIDESQSGPPVPSFGALGHAERDSSIEIVDPPPRVRKSKKRAAPSPTPTPVRRSFYADKLLDVSEWGRRSLGVTHEAAFEILDNIALSFDEEAAARAAERAAKRVARELSSPDRSRSAHNGLHATNWT